MEMCRQQRLNKNDQAIWKKNQIDHSEKTKNPTSSKESEFVVKKFSHKIFPGPESFNWEF